MASPNSILSQTLQSITSTKVAELKKQYATSAAKRNDHVAKADACKDDPETRIQHLINGVKALDPSASGEKDLHNIVRWLEQSRHDPTISKATLEGFESQMRKRLDVQMRKLDFASLYSSLLTEWLSKPTMVDEDAPLDDSGSMESFEILERDRLKDLKEKFEEVVFNPHETDEVEIDNYCRNIFKGEKGEAALSRLRREMSTAIPSMEETAPFNPDQLKWCIKSLLCEQLLKDEKKKILKDFLPDDVALKEISDVLNMRWNDLDHWHWDAGANGMPVEPRRQLNGKWRVMVDEDILQAIFIEYIGIKFNVAFKHIFTNILHSAMWRRSPRLSAEEMDRRRFYLGHSPGPYEKNVDSIRQDEFRSEFFLSNLPSSIREIAGSYDDDDEEADRNDQTKKSFNEVRQKLLRKITVEVMFQKYLHGNVAVLQTDLQWYATALPHSTIYALLRFCGVSEAWIAFFKKFLEAPLNMEPVSDYADPQVKIRKRGVPISHALEKTFGELVLVFMDLAVNQETGMLLYRLHDDIWISGEASECAKTWKTMQDFAKTMGVEFNRKKTGSVHLGSYDDGEKNELVRLLPQGPVTMGFLKIDPTNARWIIDEEAANAHTKQLKKQLNGCTSVFAWIQMWNSCIGRFFGTTLGDPAICLGKEHVDRVIRLHTNMQKELFETAGSADRSVVDHLKDMITERFDVDSVPDGFLFLPQELGGLGLRNPFVRLFLVRDNLGQEPKAVIGKYLKEEEESYKRAKETFETMGAQARRRRFREIYTQDSKDENSSVEYPDIDEFMSFAEFTRWRERTSGIMRNYYTSLLQTATEKTVYLSERVRKELERDDQGEFAPEQQWLVQLYSDELFEKFGGVNIVDQTLLPLGVMTMIKSSKVKWQMVL